jgi:hypothetical protein
MDKQKGPGGRPTKYKPEYCQMVIEHMKAGNSFWSFAATIGVSIESLSEWCQVHPEFSEAKKQGKAIELALWEKILLSCATGNKISIPNSKNSSGPPNATMIIFSLKNKFPNLYRDRMKIDTELTVNDESLLKFSEVEKTKILKAALDAKMKKLQNPDVDLE